MIEEKYSSLVIEKNILFATQLNFIKRRNNRGMTPDKIARLIINLKIKDVKTLVKTNS